MESITFCDQRKSNVEGRESKVHHIPFTIHYNGPANVQKRLSSSIQVDPVSKDQLKAEFRCRPLRGEKLAIPEGYKGIVTDTSSKSSPSGTSFQPRRPENGCNGGPNNSLFIQKEFKELTYWNWDKVTSSADPHVKVVDWLHIASSLHSPESM